MRWPPLLVAMAAVACEQQTYKKIHVPFGQPAGPGPPLLGPDTFINFVKSAPLVLVMFGTSWCPWTQGLDPVFYDAWEMLQTNPFAAEVRLGKVDCNATESEPLCESQNITACKLSQQKPSQQACMHAGFGCGLEMHCSLTVVVLAEQILWCGCSAASKRRGVSKQSAGATSTVVHETPHLLSPSFDMFSSCHRPEVLCQL